MSQDALTRLEAWLDNNKSIHLDKDGEVFCGRGSEAGAECDVQKGSQPLGVGLSS